MEGNPLSTNSKSFFCRLDHPCTTTTIEQRLLQLAAFRAPWSRNLHAIALLLQLKVAFSNQTVSGHS
jgi:hypothetical protein